MGKSYSEWDTIQKCTFVWVSDEESDDEDDEPVPKHSSINNNFNVVSPHESKGNESNEELMKLQTKLFSRPHERKLKIEIFSLTYLQLLW